MNLFNIIKLDAVPSTQDYLMSMDLDDLQDWTVVISRSQTKGKGQFENKWESEDGMNITMSILLKPSFLQPSEQFVITQILSLGIYDFLSSYIDNVYIKWPNDIYVQKKKICGMLVCNKLIGMEYSYALCGIGININQREFLFAPNPTSVALESGKNYDVDKLSLEILGFIKKRYDSIKGSKIEVLKSEYLSHLLYYGVYRRYIYLERELIAKIIDVNEYGYLVMSGENGVVFECELKELKFIH